MGLEMMVAKEIAKRLEQAVRDYAGRNDERIKAAWEEARDEFDRHLKEAQQAQERRIQVLEDAQPGRAAEIQELLDRHANEKEFNRLRCNVGYEAARETTRARLRMLAYMALGLEVSPLPIGQLARVERTIRELDPPDVRLLDELARTPAGGITDAVYARWSRAGASAYVLDAAGCVSVVTAGGAGVIAPATKITPVGTWVLEILEVYVAAIRLEVDPAEAR